MRFIFVVSSFLFLSIVVNASTELKAICPSNIMCNYDEGTCDQPDGWYINFLAGSAFTGTQNLELSGIFGVKASASNIDPYGKNRKTKIECYYLPGGIKAVVYVQKLVGENWSFSGFGKTNGICSDISDPSQCAGEE